MDTIAINSLRADVHLGRVADGHWEGTMLGSGTMAAVHGIERVRFPYVQALQEGHSTVGDLVYAAVQHAQLQPQQALAGVLQNGLLYSSDWG